MGDIDKRAQTLQALSEYITAQRLLLTKTQADVERLNELKNRVIAQPSRFLENLSEELDNTTFRLSEQVERFSEIRKPKDIDWSVYEKHDPNTFHSLSHPPPPQSYPSTPISTHGLREYVRTARTTILDPIFTQFNLSYNPEPEIDLEPETEGKRGTREQEHQKIRDLKKRKVVCGGLTVNVSSSTTRSGGVYVRRDIPDESMEVDVDVGGDLEKKDDDERVESTIKTKPKPKQKQKQRPPPPRRERRVVVPQPPMVLTKSPRLRRPSLKVSMDEEGDKSRLKGPTIIIPGLRHPRRTRVTSTSTESSSMTPPVFSGTRSRSRSHSHSRSRLSSPATSPEPEMEVSDDTAAEGGKRKKVRPETYKQAWSISEQHLLERLLVEIPDGSKNRWKQISLGMGGRRTPRQVASRVQKYFEKLRKYDAV